MCDCLCYRRDGPKEWRVIADLWLSVIKRKDRPQRVKGKEADCCCLCYKREDRPNF